jgi:hypothetical protein
VITDFQYKPLLGPRAVGSVNLDRDALPIAEAAERPARTQHDGHHQRDDRSASHVVTIRDRSGGGVSGLSHARRASGDIGEHSHSQAEILLTRPTPWHNVSPVRVGIVGVALLASVAVGGCGFPVTETFQTVPASQGPLKPGASVTTACEQAIFRLVELDWRHAEIPATVYESMLQTIFAACTFDELIAFGDKVAPPEDYGSWSAKWDKGLFDDRCQVGGTFAGSLLCETSAGRL